MEQNTKIKHRFTPVFGGEIAVVRIGEVIKQLEEAYVATYRKGHSLERAWQLACADQVVRELTGAHVHVKRNADGAPHLVGSSKTISISHTGDYMAVYLHDDQRIAIDIELLGRNIDAVSRRFALPEEIELLESNGAREALLQLWSIKESLFKVIPVDNVLFKEHLILQSVEFDTDRWMQTCRVKHPKHEAEYSVVSRIFEPLILTYTLV